MKEDRFSIVGRSVSSGDLCIILLCKLLKKRIAHVPAALFRTDLSFLGFLCDITVQDFIRHVPFPAKLSAERFVPVGFRSAESVMHVTGIDFQAHSFSQRTQSVQQRHRIRSARQSYQNAAALLQHIIFSDSFDQLIFHHSAPHR